MVTIGNELLENVLFPEKSSKPYDQLELTIVGFNSSVSLIEKVIMFSKLLIEKHSNIKKLDCYKYSSPKLNQGNEASSFSKGNIEPFRITT